MKADANGIIVSNHGGQQLDGAIPPLVALPDIANQISVLVDGGIRRGTDIIKALALGGNFIFVGRPLLYAATVAGLAGVLKAGEILKDELHRNMARLGVTAIDEISKDYLVRLRS